MAATLEAAQEDLNLNTAARAGITLRMHRSVVARTAAAELIFFVILNLSGKAFRLPADRLIMAMYRCPVLRRVVFEGPQRGCTEHP